MVRTRRSVPAALIMNGAAKKIFLNNSAAKSANSGLKKLTPTSKISFRRPPIPRIAPLIPQPISNPPLPLGRQDGHAGLVSAIFQSINLMESVCRFMKSNVRKMCDVHTTSDEQTLANTVRRIQKPRLRIITPGNRKLKKGVPVKKRGIKVSSLKDVPPGLARSDATLVPFDENRSDTFTTCEVPEVADPEKGSRCFAYYRGEMPGSQDDEVSEYYVKNDERSLNRSENRGEKFKKLPSESTTNDSSVEPME